MMGNFFEKLRDKNNTKRKSKKKKNKRRKIKIVGINLKYSEKAKNFAEEENQKEFQKSRENLKQSPKKLIST